MGTLAYCSPEQIEGKELDSRSDIYSLGITMFEILTGKMPIEPDTHTLLSWYKAHRNKPPKRFADALPSLKLPPGLEDLIMGCMAKTPDQRPQDMVEILGLLEQIRTQQKTLPTNGTATPSRSSAKAEETIIDAEPVVRTDASKSTHVPVIPLPQKRFWSIEQAGWSVPWPSDKPIAEIAFPQILTSEQEAAVGLWVMLSRAEIQQRLLSTRYNHFLCVMAPHPMLLWVTAIHDAQIGARWMPCYLDLKLEQSQQMLKLLSSKGYYLLLFFASESTSEPANVKTVTIAPYQRQLFQDWLVMAKQGISTARPSVSKQILKTEFDRIKPSMLKKLETARAANDPVIF
jgi:serine/threonine-protein kinase